MQFYFEPDPGNESPAVTRMVVEIPKDSSNKYEYDRSLGLFRLSRRGVRFTLRQGANNSYKQDECRGVRTRRSGRQLSIESA